VTLRIRHAPMTRSSREPTPKKNSLNTQYATRENTTKYTFLYEKVSQLGQICSGGHTDPKLMRVMPLRYWGVLTSLN
jgi:hypothetical protein